jgi:hypothetical protein
VEAKEVFVGVGLGVLVLAILLVVFGGVIGTGNVVRFENDTNQTSCYDSDGGVNYYVYGYTNVSNLNNYTTNYDVCSVNASVLFERYCSGGTSSFVAYVCPYGCANGVCSNQVPTCTDSDGGLNYYIKGTANNTQGSTGADSCTSSATVKEYYCDSYTGQVLSINHNCLSGESCVNGACVQGGNQTNSTCYDSDGGMNGAVKGYVIFSGYTVYDSCNDNSHVSEAICNSQNQLEWWPISCPNGCSNGACVQGGGNQTNTNCTDSDGGLNYYVKGRTYGYNNIGLYYSVDDSCEVGVNLYENYCNGTTPLSIKYSCINGCSNGACVQGGGNQTMDYLLQVTTITNATYGYNDDAVRLKDVNSPPDNPTYYDTTIFAEGAGTVSIRGISYSLKYYKDPNSNSDGKIQMTDPYPYPGHIIGGEYIYKGGYVVVPVATPVPQCTINADCPMQTTKKCDGNSVVVNSTYFSCQGGLCVKSGGSAGSGLCPSDSVCIDGVCNKKVSGCSLWNKIFHPSQCKQIPASEIKSISSSSQS